ncbi:hypothetical protein DIT72_13395 [Marinobacter orientalis]|nr:hypothetical protein DIT72_13395 [Marinobacter orientalis]
MEGYKLRRLPWRDVYLTGAYELRHGVPDNGLNAAEMEEVLLNTPVTRFFDTMAVRLKADEAGVRRHAGQAGRKVQYRHALTLFQIGPRAGQLCSAMIQRCWAGARRIFHYYQGKCWRWRRRYRGTVDQKNGIFNRGV